VNRLVGAIVGRLGVPVPAVWMLEVAGRHSGRPRRTPVCLLRLGDRHYVVAPRGQTHWARNLRAAGHATLVRGRCRRPVVAVEAAGAEREVVVGAYVRRFGWLTGRFFDLPPRPSREAVRAVAPRHPAFRVHRHPGGLPTQ
jgi:deazaflavin-dependent oxidoreductase (nitroreductase family)